MELLLGNDSLTSTISRFLMTELFVDFDVEYFHALGLVSEKFTKMNPIFCSA